MRADEVTYQEKMNEKYGNFRKTLTNLIFPTFVVRTLDVSNISDITKDIFPAFFSTTKCLVK